MPPTSLNVVAMCLSIRVAGSCLLHWPVMFWHVVFFVPCVVLWCAVWQKSVGKLGASSWSTVLLIQPTSVLFSVRQPPWELMPYYWHVTLVTRWTVVRSEYRWERSSLYHGLGWTVLSATWASWASVQLPWHSRTTLFPLMILSWQPNPDWLSWWVPKGTDFRRKRLQKLTT